MAAQPDGIGVLRFHERCGEAVIVADNGMTVEKREKLQQADIEHGELCKYVSFVVIKKKTFVPYLAQIPCMHIALFHPRSLQLCFSDQNHTMI